MGGGRVTDSAEVRMLQPQCLMIKMLMGSELVLPS